MKVLTCIAFILSLISCVDIFIMAHIYEKDKAIMQRQLDVLYENKTQQNIVFKRI